MKVPFLDLRITNEEERRELLSAVDAVFSHGRIVLGPEIQEIERKVADYCSRSYAVGVNSGTDALFLGLKSMGIGQGDEVITTSLSWVATANAIALTGATPVFADIQDDLNIDPESVRKLISPRTKAIMPVHYTGKVCKMDCLMEIAGKNGLMVIEDASQAFGASYDGRKAGSFGTVACFSMNPMKILAACGEAGMLVTDRKDICEKALSLRYNGTVNRELCVEPGLNGRMDTLQAAILLKRFEHVKEIIQKRREIAAWYNQQLEGVVEIPKEKSGEFDVYYSYTIRANRRDELKDFLESKGIETKIQHPYLMPHQPAYRDGVKGEYANAELIVKQILSIPANEKITAGDAGYVASCIKEFYGRTV